MKRIALILALALAGVANAGTLGLHIGSQHYPARDFNNANPGVYYIHSSGATIGTHGHTPQEAYSNLERMYV